MAESLRGPDQQVAAINSVRAELNRRNLVHIKSSLEVVRQTFPEVVSDAERLSEALISDGFSQFMSEGVDGLDSPDAFLHGSILPDIESGRKTTLNKDLYIEITEKYYARKDTDRATSLARMELGFFFGEVFQMSCGNILNTSFLERDQSPTH